MKSIISLVRWVCPVCNSVFTPTHHLQKYCSQVCRVEADKAHSRNYWRKKRGPLKPKLCSVCDTEFVPTYGYQKYCSRVCAYLAKKARQKRYMERNGG